jgi:hypothetical protein
MTVDIDNCLFEKNGIETEFEGFGGAVVVTNLVRTKL